MVNYIVKTISIKKHQDKYLKERFVSLSAFVQENIEIYMKKDKRINKR